MYPLCRGWVGIESIGPPAGFMKVKIFLAIQPVRTYQSYMFLCFKPCMVFCPLMLLLVTVTLLPKSYDKNNVIKSSTCSYITYSVACSVSLRYKNYGL